MYDELETEYFRYQFVKSFLCNIFQNRIYEPTIKVLRLVARDGIDSFRLKPLTVSSSVGDDTSFVMDDNVEATLMYKESYYDLMIHKYHLPYTKDYQFIIGALGLSEKAMSPTDLIEFILKEACTHSTFLNKYLFIKPSPEDAITSIEVTPQNLEITFLNDIFLPQDTKSSLQLFVDCIRSFERIGQPLRYLLSGKPGTAKTKIIRAIANEAKGYATFVFTNGADNRLDAIFDFAECFRPSVICIDDADLMVGNRQDFTERVALGKFLQRMDGFIGSSVFVLATTNDKRLVDIAASRAGRFDRVLDLTAIDAEQYRNLISTITDSEDLSDLFNDEVITTLKEKSVSGAFLTNLIKQLSVIMQLSEDKQTSETVLNLIDRLYKGFNGKSTDSDKPFGFRN